MTIQLCLYGTSACHLCDQATSLLQKAKTRADIEWREVDIADDTALMQRYGLIIPVLSRQDDGHELLWPFTTRDILDWLQGLETRPE